jgi:hypothetical protein
MALRFYFRRFVRLCRVGVGQPMSLQMPALTERGAAAIASVRLARGVRERVDLEVAAHVERLAADFAGKRSRASVLEHVRLHASEKVGLEDDHFSCGGISIQIFLKSYGTKFIGYDRTPATMLSILRKKRKDAGM